ncbi:MAG: ATP-binding cassette domain-containing protein, partial [Castellaniella sp.]|uniref:ABC transporter ATP-binding protein n=1 Tax=Castellaniella sp. TaxID=1955812 RepID=UPI00121DEADB
SAEAHAVTALIGPNGAGKTTLFNLITGQIVPGTGLVRFNGVEITRFTPQARVHLGVGRTFQDVRLFHNMSVAENIILGMQRLRGEGLAEALFLPWAVRGELRRAYRRATELLERVGLVRFADELAGNLSYGQQKLVAIARLLAAEPEILLLDEPTSGVDPRMLSELVAFLEKLRDSGRTVLLIEHNLDIVRLVATQCAFMESGRVLRVGSTEDILSDSELVNKYLGLGTVNG